MVEETITIPKIVWESEKKMRFFGGNAQDIYNKKYNIFIGISISNKKITPQMALNYLNWAIRNTKGQVAVVIADELNVVNYEIFDHYSSGKAKNRANTVGNQFQKMFEEAIKKLPAAEKNKVNIFRWKEINQNEHYQIIKQLLENEYKKDTEFKSAILYFIRKYMKKKGKTITDEEKLDKLATYILGELPTLLEGINFRGVYYKLCLYPTYFSSGLSQFVMDIHEEELEIGKKLKKFIKQKAILVEAWLD